MVVRKWKYRAIVGLAILICGLFVACGGKYEVYKETRLLMDTIVNISIGGAGGESARSAAALAFEEIARVEALLSSYRPESEISRLNAAGTSGPVQVSEEAFALLMRGEEIRAASGGAFDVTVGPMVELWAFDEGGRVPADEEIDTALASVGGSLLEFDGAARTVRFLAPGMKIDLGAIGKGYAVDRAAEVLKAAGINSAIIDAGGDIRLLGSRPGKDFWRIRVKHPRKVSRPLVDLDLAETAIVTSGDYERFFMVGETRYHHILDPRTGMPARLCQSVTVVAPDTAGADAYATAAFVLGPEEGLRYLRSLPGVEGIIVDAKGELLWTDEEKMGQ